MHDVLIEIRLGVLSYPLYTNRLYVCGLWKMPDTENLVHFRVVRFIYEAGLKLRMKTIPLSTTCVLYHRFFRENKLDDFDPYLIAATCLYLAGKVEEEQNINLRDVVNVTYRTLNREKPALEMGDKYWQYRDTIVNCELFMLRSLHFKSVVYHPHKFILHYLKYLEDWFDPVTWAAFPLTRTCWGILRDSYHSPIALRFKPQHIAIAVIYMGVLSHGLEVPYNKTADSPWWKVFKEDITLNEIKDIINEIVYAYDMENMLQT